MSKRRRVFHRVTHTARNRQTDATTARRASLKNTWLFNIVKEYRLIFQLTADTSSFAKKQKKKKEKSQGCTKVSGAEKGWNVFLVSFRVVVVVYIISTELSKAVLVAFCVCVCVWCVCAVRASGSLTS